MAEDVKLGKLTSFPQSVQVTGAVHDPGETTVSPRMADPRMTGMDEGEMPFDMKRMIFGGFEVIVDV